MHSAALTATLPAVYTLDCGAACGRVHAGGEIALGLSAVGGGPWVLFAAVQVYAGGRSRP